PIDTTQPPATPPAPGAPDDDLTPRRPSVRLSFGIAFALGLSAALLFGVGALYAYDRQFSGRILPGVHVGVVDLSGMDADQARAALLEAYGDLAEGRLVINGAAGEHTIAYVDVGRGPDLEGMLAEAGAVGRFGSPVDRVVADARTAVRGVYLEPRVTFDPARLTAEVSSLADSISTDAIDARVEATTKGGFTVIDGTAGRSADPVPLINA